MNWQALWNDGAVISVHALVALVAMGAGAVQLASPKGTTLHKAVGYFWVGAMCVVAVSSFWISRIPVVGAVLNHTCSFNPGYRDTDLLCKCDPAGTRLRRTETR